MKSEVNAYPEPDDVLADLGEKAIRAFALAVRCAKADLDTYRATFPQWVADHSERGLANWISDRVWAHLSDLAEDVSSMTVTESGPLREITVGINYRCRVKRHSGDDVSSYPTQAFLDFVSQPEAQLPGMEETRLIAGYDWIKDLRDIGDAVISLRDGKDNVIWKEPLPEVDDEHGAGSAPVATPERSQPSRPTVEIPDGIGRKPEEAAKGE
jgi:hypothetical protein